MIPQPHFPTLKIVFYSIQLTLSTPPIYHTGTSKHNLTYIYPPPSAPLPTFTSIINRPNYPPTPNLPTPNRSTPICPSTTHQPCQPPTTSVSSSTPNSKSYNVYTLPFSVISHSFTSTYLTSSIHTINNLRTIKHTSTLLSQPAMPKHLAITHTNAYITLFTKP